MAADVIPAISALPASINHILAALDGINKIWELTILSEEVCAFSLVHFLQLQSTDMIPVVPESCRESPHHSQSPESKASTPSLQLS